MWAGKHHLETHKKHTHTCAVKVGRGIYLASGYWTKRQQFWPKAKPWKVRHLVRIVNKRIPVEGWLWYGPYLCPSDGLTTTQCQKELRVAPEHWVAFPHGQVFMHSVFKYRNVTKKASGRIITTTFLNVKYPPRSPSHSQGHLKGDCNRTNVILFRSEKRCVTISFNNVSLLKTAALLRSRWRRPFG